MGTEAFVGWRGHGKTMLAVERARRLARMRGVPLIANIWVAGEEPVVKVRDGVVSIIRPGIVVERIPLGKAKGSKSAGLDVDWLIDRLWRLKEEQQGAVVLLDEAGVLFSAREWQHFPAELGYLIAQGRRLRVDLVYTSQFIDQVDKVLRELTEVAHKVRAWPAPTVLGRETGRRPWLMWTSTYRPAQVDQSEKRLGRAWMRYARRRERVYDTDEFVLPLRYHQSGPEARPEDRSRQGAPAHPKGRSAAEDGGAVAVAAPVVHSLVEAGTSEPADRPAERAPASSSGPVPER